MEAAARIIETTRKHWESTMGARPQEPKLITLEDWADRMFGEARPHRNTLRNWRKAGLISPLPVKCGRTYFVEPDAVYMDDAGELARRLVHGS
ncbi:excisionase [Cupriavidus campinensis]|uniref:excisionase n=1 Tax=Cupriavidus campinensis TaxID=151783 RepID=UPI0024E1DBED|nr:excisionase [Cupriavidus campinensis]